MYYDFYVRSFCQFLYMLDAFEVCENISERVEKEAI